MSPLTRWLAISAAAAIALFVCNAIVYRRRHGTFLPVRRKAEAPYLKQRVAGQDVALLCLFVLALLAGTGAPYLAPESSFSEWLASPFANFVYFAWCFLGIVGIGVLRGIYMYFAAARRERHAQVSATDPRQPASRE